MDVDDNVDVDDREGTVDCVMLVVVDGVGVIIVVVVGIEVVKGVMLLSFDAVDLVVGIPESADVAN